jgi:uncharacterized protein YlxW (UPF0749 family)
MDQQTAKDLANTIASNKMDAETIELFLGIEIGQLTAQYQRMITQLRGLLDEAVADLSDSNGRVEQLLTELDGVHTRWQDVWQQNIQNVPKDLSVGAASCPSCGDGLSLTVYIQPEGR